MGSKILKLFLLISLCLFIAVVSGLLYETLEPYDYSIYNYIAKKRDYVMIIPTVLLVLSVFSLIFNFNKFSSLRIKNKFSLRLVKAIDLLFSILLILSAIVGTVFVILVSNHDLHAIAFIVITFLFIFGIILFIDNRKFSTK